VPGGLAPSGFTFGQFTEQGGWKSFRRRPVLVRVSCCGRGRDAWSRQDSFLGQVKEW